MDTRILFIDDEPGISKDLSEIFDGKEISNHKLVTDFAETFEEGLDKISNKYFDLIVSDLCKGKPSKNAEKEGLEVLKEIQEKEFIPIIFYSGIANAIKDLESEIVGVIDKKEGVTSLEKEIHYMISSNMATLRGSIEDFVNSELREYFWDIVHDKRDIFKPKSGDYSLGYLMLRRLANALSKEKIKDLLSDKIINKDKAHPMEFYIYPTNSSQEYSMGEILEKDGEYYIIITPSCDFQDRGSGKRNVEFIVLNKTFKLSSLPQHDTYINSQSSTSHDKLERFISNKNPRFFFLPKTPFIPNLVMDFQSKELIKYADLSSYTRLAILDSPFSESMLISHINYYNRIGTPDIDVDYILTNL